MRFSRILVLLVAAAFGLCLAACSGGSGRPRAAASTPPSAPVDCRYQGVRVACSNSGGEFDADSGCYIQRMAPSAVPSGPIRREYEAKGGAIVRVSDCLDGSLWRYMWVASAAGSAPATPSASASDAAS